MNDKVIRLLLALSLTSCGDFITALYSAKQEVQRDRKQAQERSEHENYKRDGYKACEKPQGINESDCFDLTDLRTLKKGDINPKDANALLPLITSGEMVNLKRDGCAPSPYISTMQTLEGERKKGNVPPAPTYDIDEYARSICTGKVTLQQLLAYDQRFRVSPKSDDGYVLDLIAKGISPEAANAFPPEYKVKEVLYFHRTKAAPTIAWEYREVTRPFLLESWEAVKLHQGKVNPKLAEWYFNIRKRYYLPIGVEEIIDLEQKVHEKELTRELIEKIARDEYQHQHKPHQYVRQLLLGEHRSEWRLKKTGELQTAQVPSRF